MTLEPWQATENDTMRSRKRGTLNTVEVKNLVSHYSYKKIEPTVRSRTRQRRLVRTIEHSELHDQSEVNVPATSGV